MKCFQNYKVKYIKHVRHRNPFTVLMEYWEEIEVEEALQFIKSTNCFYEFYNKQTGKRFKVRKEDVKSYEEL